jgi:hypothetical protein
MGNKRSHRKVDIVEGDATASPNRGRAAKAASRNNVERGVARWVHDFCFAEAVEFPLRTWLAGLKQ